MWVRWQGRSGRPWVLSPDAPACFCGMWPPASPRPHIGPDISLAWNPSLINKRLQSLADGGRGPSSPHLQATSLATSLECLQTRQRHEPESTSEPLGNVPEPSVMAVSDEKLGASLVNGERVSVFGLREEREGLELRWAWKSSWRR